MGGAAVFPGLKVGGGAWSNLRRARPRAGGWARFWPEGLRGGQQDRLLEEDGSAVLLQRACGQPSPGQRT